MFFWRKIEESDNDKVQDDRANHPIVSIQQSQVKPVILPRLDSAYKLY